MSDHGTWHDADNKLQSLRNTQQCAWKSPSGVLVCGDRAGHEGIHLPVPSKPDVREAPVPTLCRWVQYRLGNGEWIAAVVVDDLGATPDLVVELELHPPSRLSIVPDAGRPRIAGASLAGPSPMTAAGLVVRDAVRGDGEGNWRWPPKV